MKQHSVLWWVLLILGLAGTLWLLAFRFSAEQADRDVLAVMSPEDLAFLAEQSGLPVQDWAALFGDWEAFAFAYGMTPGEKPVPAALVENHDRTSMHLPEGVIPAEYPGQMVKTLYLYDDYANRVVGSDPREVENLLFRAVTDRGLRLLILTPFFTTEGNPVTDIAVYRDCLNGLGRRLEARGYTFGETFSCLQTADSLLPLLSGCLSILAGCALLCRLFPGVRRRSDLLCGGLLVLSCLVYLADAALFLTLLHLATAIVFPCAAAYAIGEYAKKTDDRPMWQTILRFTTGLIGWSLLGGLCVAAQMSTPVYLLGTDIFSGVKLALLLPMAFVVMVLLWNLRRQLVSSGWKTWAGLALAGLAVGGMYLLLTTRSGDAAISSIETAFRNWLEYTLYVRPRTKELLFAVPCIPVFLWACRRKYAPLQLLCGAGVCLECVSVVNTFCHAVAPLLVSVVRTLLGVGLGLVPGLLAVLALEGFHRLRTR